MSTSKRQAHRQSEETCVGRPTGITQVEARFTGLRQERSLVALISVPSPLIVSVTFGLAFFGQLSIKVKAFLSFSSDVHLSVIS